METRKPVFFMIDYSEAELLAILSNVLLACKYVYLCDFHREQAWERWINKHKIKEFKECLLSLLRSCADAPPSSDSTFSKDLNYQINIPVTSVYLICMIAS